MPAGDVRHSQEAQDRANRTVVIETVTKRMTVKWLVWTEKARTDQSIVSAPLAMLAFIVSAALDRAVALRHLVLAARTGLGVAQRGMLQ